jgi:hypothetical protein
VEVFDIAIADEKGVARFDPCVGPAVGRLAAHGSIEVETRALDELVEARRLSPPSVIKMDIEGGEVAALRGAEKTLAVHRPTLLIATHGPSVHRETLAILHARGYEVSGLSGGPAEATDELVARPARKR